MAQKLGRQWTIHSLNDIYRARVISVEIVTHVLDIVS